MEKFNPNEAVLYQKKPSPEKFDPSQAIPESLPEQSKTMAGDASSYPNQQFRDKLLEGLKQTGLSTEDFLKGISSGVQNTGAYATSGLPQSMQIPRYDPAPTSKQGRYPIEAGKIGTSLLSAFLTEGASLPAMEAVGVPASAARVLSSMAGGAASAPSVDASPTTGAAIGGIGAGIPELGMQALGRYLGKNVTPAQFESARQAIPSNIKAPIGELADSPRAKTRYGKARATALSQADTPYQQIYDHLKKSTESLFSDVPNVSNPSQHVYDDVEKSYESAVASRKKKYKTLGAYADENDLPFNNTSFKNAIDSSIKEIKGETTNETTEKLYRESLKTLKDFRQSITPSLIRDEPRINSFGNALSSRRAINDLMKKASRKDDKLYLRHLKIMKDGIDSSLEESSSQDPKLFELFQDANNSRIHQGTYEKLNRDNKSPFFKIYDKEGTPDNLIGSHIKSSTKGDDYSGLLEALTEKLSPNAKGVMAKAHVQPTEKTSLANQIAKIKKLSPTQRDLMFGKKAPTAHSIAKIAGLYPSAASSDFTPMTGYTGAKLTQILGELAGLSSGLTAGAATHSPGIAAASLAASGFLPAKGQLTQRALRSEALKNAHMRYLQRAGKEALTKSTPTGKALQSALLSLLGGNQNGA